MGECGEKVYILLYCPFLDLLAREYCLSELLLSVPVDISRLSVSSTSGLGVYEMKKKTQENSPSFPKTASFLLVTFQIFLVFRLYI